MSCQIRDSLYYFIMPRGSKPEFHCHSLTQTHIHSIQHEILKSITSGVGGCLHDLYQLINLSSLFFLFSLSLLFLSHCTFTTRWCAFCSAPPFLLWLLTSLLPLSLGAVATCYITAVQLKWSSGPMWGLALKMGSLSWGRLCLMRMRTTDLPGNLVCVDFSSMTHLWKTAAFFLVFPCLPVWGRGRYIHDKFVWRKFDDLFAYIVFWELFFLCFHTKKNPNSSLFFFISAKSKKSKKKQKALEA